MRSLLNRSVKYYTFLSKWEYLIVFELLGAYSLGMVNFLILLNTNVKLPPSIAILLSFSQEYTEKFELYAYEFMNKILLLLMEMSTYLNKVIFMWTKLEKH